jgi:hypothetical protein
VRGSILRVSSLKPIFLIRISLIYLKATGTSPNSMISIFGTKLRITVVVLTSKNVLLTSVANP